MVTAPCVGPNLGIDLAHCGGLGAQPSRPSAGWCVRRAELTVFARLSCLAQHVLVKIALVSPIFHRNVVDHVLNFDKQRWSGMVDSAPSKRFKEVVPCRSGFR